MCGRGWGAENNGLGFQQTPGEKKGSGKWPRSTIEEKMEKGPAKKKCL